MQRLRLKIETYVLELHDVLMIHRLQQFCLLLEQLNAFLLQSLALDHLHGNLLIGFFVNGAVYCAERALTEDALKLVMIRIRFALLKLA